MIKNLGEVATEFRGKILNKVNSEEIIIPEDWSIGLISPIYKKGDERTVITIKVLTY